MITLYECKWEYDSFDNKSVYASEIQSHKDVLAMKMTGLYKEYCVSAYMDFMVDRME